MTILTRLAYWYLHRHGTSTIPTLLRADMLYHFSELVHSGMRHYQEQILPRLTAKDGEIPPRLKTFYYAHVPFILEQSVRGIVDHAIDALSSSDAEGQKIATALGAMRRDDVTQATWRIADAQKRESSSL